MIQVVDSDEILLSLEESIYQLAISSSNYIPVTYGTLHIVKGDLFGFMEAIGNNGQRVIRMFDNIQKKWYTGWLDNTTGNLSALTTTAKDSLVSAVNEVNNLVSPVKVGSTATTNKFTVDTTSLKTGLYLITANLPSTAEVGSVFVFTKTNVGKDGMSKIFKIFSTHDETIIEGGNIEFFSGSWYSDVYLKKII